MLSKSKELAIFKNINSLNYIIQSDGGVERSTYKNLIDVGTESFVLGRTALFGKSERISEACKIMKSEFLIAIN